MRHGDSIDRYDVAEWAARRCATSRHEGRGAVSPRGKIACARAAAAIARISAALLALAAPAVAQTWGLAPSTFVDLPTSAGVDCDCPDSPTPCSATGGTVLVPGFLGNDLAWVSGAACSDGGLTSGCGCRALGEAIVRLDGLGSPTVRIRWDAVANVNHDCHEGNAHSGPCSCPSDYLTTAMASMLVSIDLTVVGMPPGTPVTVSYRWNQLSANMYRREDDPTDDTSMVSGGSLDADGTALFGSEYDLVNMRGVRAGPGGTGSFGSTTGSTVTVDSTVTLFVLIQDPARGSFNPCIEYDSESTAWGGEIVLSLAGPPGPPPDLCAGGPTLEFSLDIASASELSDPGPDANDRFDPGDLYPTGGPPLPLGGADGPDDDAAIFTGFDPMPDPPDGPPPTSAAPACSGAPPPTVSPIYFDLDATDAVNVSLTGMIPPGPLPAPIPRFPSSCVHDARYLLLSYDDDGGGHFVAVNPGSGVCEVPPFSPSPSGAIHGSTAFRDEVVGLLLVPTPTGMAAAAYPFASESALHASLAPNPPAASFVTFTPEDDDVDALDVNDGCPVSLLSFDHEADEAVIFAPPGPDPGGIYEVTGLGAVQVVDDVTHLGIAEATDLDAFEFVFTPDTGGGGDVLGLLYSVADDDPLTPPDESGGLDPNMIYASYLTGSSFPFLAAPLPDDVDAITAWCRPLLRPPTGQKVRQEQQIDGEVTRTY